MRTTRRWTCLRRCWARRRRGGCTRRWSTTRRRSAREGVGVTLSEAAAAGDWRLLFLERDEIKKVTEQDVLRVAKAYLKASNRTLGEFIPTKTPDRAEIPAPPDVTARFKDFKGGEGVT